LITFPSRTPGRTADRPESDRPDRTPLPWVTATVAGLAVLLAGTPVQVLVRDGWVGCAVAAVAVVVATGLLLHRLAVPLIAAAQCIAVLVLLTAWSTYDGVLGVLPGPAAVGRLGELINGAGRRIGLEVAPVAPSPEILVLVSAAFGLLAVAVHLAAVSARAPAAAGLPLLAAFAIPAALADALLPTPTVVAAAAGYGLLLMTGAGSRSWRALLHRLPTAIALVTVAILLAVGLGSGAAFIGTGGRFAGGAGTTSTIGLSPFTSLRGQLTDGAPAELLRVRGLQRAAYLRVVTLSQYVTNTGWRATRPAPGMPLPGPVQLQPGAPGDVADIQIENVGLYDYWLPLYGEPMSVDGLPPAQWSYDQRSGTGYTLAPRQDDSWQERTLLLRPSADELRRATAAPGAAPGYDALAGVDPRVIRLAREVTAGRDTEFDRAMALQDYFTGPDSAFRYSLQTAPSGGDDALVEFLTVGRTGYCEQFASAMAVMLRAVGIPSRVAVGFTGGTDFGDYRSIRTSDAHAWVEAYFPGTGWVLFDPTPLADGRTITPEYVLEARGQLGPDGADTSGDTGSGRLEQDQPVPAPPPVEPPPVAGPATAGADAGWLVGLGWALLALAGLTGAALAPAAIRSRQRERRLAAVAAGGAAAADAGWQEVLAESVDRGVPGNRSDTVRATARRLVREHRLGPGTQQALRTVVAGVESSWYGGRHPEPAELLDPIRTVRAGIAIGSPISLRRRLLPRSLRTGRLRITQLRIGRSRTRPRAEPTDTDRPPPTGAGPVGGGR
jgi:transglutaminase-like putative cysteine protease